MKRIVFLVFTLFMFWGNAQEKITLEECYNWVSINYPLAKQKELLDKQLKFDIDAISAEKLPQFDLSAQATYQSDVTEVPIPNSSVEPLNKDQYKATITANQLIYGGGVVPASVKVREAEAKAMQQQVEVNLYQLKKQVNQLYFSILLLQEKQKLLIAKKGQLEAKLKEVKSGVQYGVLLPSSDKVLEAELLKINQQFIEIEQNKLSLLKTLSSLTGKEISSHTVLTDTEISVDVSDSLKRPEMSLFNYKKEQLDASKELIAKENIPKLMGFATGGYGNPGLNMLDNSFQAYYMVGLKLNWNVFDWNANKRKRESLQVNSDIIDNEESIFQLNTSIELDQQLSEIQKLISIIDTDKEIVKLREEVLASANSQLQNGVITSSQYITELTNLYEAQNELSTHKIQLKLAKATYNTIKGQ